MQAQRRVSKRCLAWGKTAGVEGGVLSASCLQTSVQIPSSVETTSDTSDATASLECESYMLGDY